MTNLSLLTTTKDLRGRNERGRWRRSPRSCGVAVALCAQLTVSQGTVLAATPDSSTGATEIDEEAQGRAGPEDPEEPRDPAGPTGPEDPPRVAPARRPLADLPVVQRAGQRPREPKLSEPEHEPSSVRSVSLRGRNDRNEPQFVVGQTTVPAGNYLVLAHVVMTDARGDRWTCRMFSDEKVIAESQTITVADASNYRVRKRTGQMSLMGETSKAGTVSIRCSNTDPYYRSDGEYGLEGRMWVISVAGFW